MSTIVVNTSWKSISNNLRKEESYPLTWMNLLFLLLTLYNCVLQSPDFEIILLLSFFFNSYENQKRNMVHTYKKDASTHFEVLCVRYGTWSCCFWFWSLKHKMLRCHSFMRVPTKISNLSVFTEHERLDYTLIFRQFSNEHFYWTCKVMTYTKPNNQKKELHSYTRILCWLDWQPFKISKVFIFFWDPLSIS